MPSFGRTWQIVARILVSGGEKAEMQLGGCRWITLRRRCLEQDVVKFAKFSRFADAQQEELRLCEVSNLFLIHADLIEGIQTRRL